MTLDQLRKQVLANVGDPQGLRWTNDTDDPRLDRLIDEVQQELAIVAERVDPTFENLSTTFSKAVEADTVYEFSLPGAFRRLNAVWRTDLTVDRLVQIVDVDRFPFYVGVDNGDVAYLRYEDDPDGSDDSEGGTANKPTRLGFMLSVTDPVTTYAYTVHYAARVTSFLGSLDGEQVSALPQAFHPLIALGATVRALMQENSDASQFKTQYDQALGIMTAALPARSGEAVA